MFIEDFVNVTIENLAPCRKLVKVTLDPETVQKKFDETIGMFQRTQKLPGFRPGKAPRHLIEKVFQKDIEGEVKSRLISDNFDKAVKEHKITPVRMPEVEEIQFGRTEGLQFAATVETEPEFEVPDYKGLPAKKEKRTVSDDDVEKALQRLREGQANFEPVAREAQTGDVVVVNYSGTTDGKPLTDIAPVAKGLTEKKGSWLKVGDGSFIPGFTEQLVGARAGDKRTVNVDFPADFVIKELEGKKGVYEVEVVEVRAANLPEINDEFAKKFELANVDDLRKNVRQTLEQELETTTRRSIREQLLTGLLNKVSCELPESVYNDEIRSVIYEVVTDNQRKGLSHQDIDAHKDQIYENAKGTARDRLKMAYLVSRIAEKEGIKVTNEDMTRYIIYQAQTNNMDPQQLAAKWKKENRFGNIANYLLHQKTVEFIEKNANIEEVEPQAAQA